VDGGAIENGGDFERLEFAAGGGLFGFAENRFALGGREGRTAVPLKAEE